MLALLADPVRRAQVGDAAALAVRREWTASAMAATPVVGVRAATEKPSGAVPEDQLIVTLELHTSVNAGPAACATAASV